MISLLEGCIFIMLILLFWSNLDKVNNIFGWLFRWLRRVWRELTFPYGE